MKKLTDIVHKVHHKYILKDLGMCFATSISKHKTRRMVIACKDCGNPIERQAYTSSSKNPSAPILCKSCVNTNKSLIAKRKYNIIDGTVTQGCTVLNEVPNDTNRKQYKVRCKCSTEFITTGQRLRNTKFVGCNKCSLKNRPQSIRTYTQVERSFKKRILDRVLHTDISVKITSDTWLTVALGNCFYCGDSPMPLKGSAREGENPLILNGIDRIDSTKGYTSDNIVACCTTCNIMKSTLPQEDFIKHIKKIYNYLKN